MMKDSAVALLHLNLFYFIVFFNHHLTNIRLHPLHLEIF